MDNHGHPAKCPFASSGSRSGPSMGAPAGSSTPGPTGLVSFDTHIDPLEFLGGLIDRYGDVVRYQTRFGPCFLFVHPEHVHTILHRENYRRASLVKMMLGEGLLASDGSLWKSQRRLMQPDFLPARVAPFISILTRETNRTTNDWQRAARDGAPVDLTAAMTRLTLRIIVQALFSDDLSDTLATELCAAITQTINDLGNISWTIFGVPVRFTPSSNASFHAGKDAIDAVCYEMIARRRAMIPEHRPPDLLTLLIEADEQSGHSNDKQLRDEIVTMLVGGHETTALSLAWAWKALAENPDVEATLHHELDNVLGGRTPTLDDLPNLPWTQAVFQEALRLYPPVWYMARVANDDDVIDGHAIPRGACVLISAWFTHRHKEFWIAPDQFNPARFLNSEHTHTHRYAYFPFGGGRHQCLGMHFALMEGTILLAQLAQQFRLRPLEGQHIEPNPGITLRQLPSLQATVELRGTATASLNAEPEAV